MPRGAAEPAAVAPAAAKAAGKKRSIAAMDEEARAMAERRKLARAAAAYAYENGISSKAALKSEQFKDSGVTYNMVEPLLKELKAGGKKLRVDAPRDYPFQILTNDERIKLAQWILACGKGQVPKNRSEISDKVKNVLRARHASNKKRQWCGGSIKLNEQEVAAVQSKERLSNNFFQRFYPWCRAHGIEIDEGVERSQDQKRAVKMTEATPSCGGIGGSHWWRVSASIILGSGASAVLCVSVLPCDSWVSVGHLSSIVVIYGCSGSVHLSESHSQTLAGICNSRPNVKS